MIDVLKFWDVYKTATYVQGQNKILSHSIGWIA